MAGIRKTIGGWALLAAACALLGWNERRAVADARHHAQGPPSAESVPPGEPPAEHEGSLVHVTGTADSEDTLVDTEFAVYTRALVMRRKVEMMQWVEKRHGKGYRYRRMWTELPVDSSQFAESGHENPEPPTYRSATFFSQNARLGGFALSHEVLESMAHFEPLDLPLNPDAAGEIRARTAREKFPAPEVEEPTPEPPKAKAKRKRRKAKRVSKAKRKAKRKRRKLKRKGKRRMAAAEPAPEPQPEPKVEEAPAEADAEPEAEPLVEDWAARGFTIYDGRALMGEGTPREPEVGDVLITYFAIPPGTISVIASQSDGTLVPHVAGDSPGLALVNSGIATVEEMAERVPPPDTAYLWLWRLLGLGLILGALRVLRERVDVFAATSVSCAVVAVVWLFYSVVVGGVVLALAVVSFLLTRRSSQGSRG